MINRNCCLEDRMHNQRITDIGYDQEDSYFHQRDLDLIAKKRADLDRQRAASTASSSGIKCPRCGAAMAEVVVEHVKVDRCTGCGGIFLDRGELEVLTHARSGGLFRGLFG
jgi:Zn-finger nucleic acid-binding protein